LGKFRGRAVYQEIEGQPYRLTIFSPQDENSFTEAIFLNTVVIKTCFAGHMKLMKILYIVVSLNKVKSLK
jgi:hypothetical protein